MKAYSDGFSVSEDATLAALRAALDTTAEGILAATADGRILHLNRSCIDLWRLPEEVVQRGVVQEIWEFTASRFSDPGHYLARIPEIHESSEAVSDILELAEGKYFERASARLLAGSRVIGRVWRFRDVTERRESGLVAHRLAAIVENSDDAIVGKDLHSIITSWNSGAERIFGYSAGEMIGTSIMRLIPPDRQPEEAEILRRIRNGERVDHFETVRVTKGGKMLDVSLTVSPIKDEFGHVVGASKIARDVTQQKLAEAAIRRAGEEAEQASADRERLLESERAARSEAERANRMKDEFLATVSHELRTPLNAILGWANILRSGQFQGEELAKGLDIIERNSRSQAQIIDDLLDMSRIISGKVRLEVQRIDLAAVLGESVETVRATADAKGLRLQVVIDPHNAIVSGDPNRLQQIFWNLLNNAIKFTPKHGRVQVLLERVNSHVEVSVIDTGEGISPDFLPFVFNRFEQADASTTRRHGGLGLGLAIVKQLVELHGGGVRVKSAGVGQGATFIVNLPLAVMHAHPSDPDRRHPKAQPQEVRSFPEVNLKGVQILVIDDEPDARQLVRRLLEVSGASVCAAGSASEAMNLLNGRPFDVVVCDIGMPNEDGYSFIRKVRALADPGKSEVAAVALTAYARLEDRTEAIRAGFQNHLSKPVEPAELLAVVRSLSKPRKSPPSSA